MFAAKNNEFDKELTSFSKAKVFFEKANRQQGIVKVKVKVKVKVNVNSQS